MPKNETQSELSISVNLSDDELNGLKSKGLERLIMPIRYMLTAMKYGGMDILDKERVPRSLTEQVAEEFGISVLTLEGYKTDWNREGLLQQARDYLAPRLWENLAIVTDVIAFDLYPRILLDLAREAVKVDSKPHTKLAIAQFLLQNVVLQAQARKPVDQSEEERYLSIVREARTGE